MGVDLTAFVGVIVDNHFVGVDVAFTGKENVSAGVFHHRHSERVDVGHGVGVFRHLKELRTLPLPGAGARFVVTAMACPHGDDIALHALGGIDVRLSRSHKRHVLSELLRELVDRRYIVGVAFVAHIERDIVIRDRVGERSLDFFPHVADQIGGDREIGEILVKTDLSGFGPCIRFHAVDPKTTGIHLPGNPVDDRVIDHQSQ